MAKNNAVPVVPDFKDLSAEATKRAEAAIQGGFSPPLTPPKGAKVSTYDKKQATYTRWSEPVQVLKAYRTITKSKLVDVVIATKVRQSTKENTGSKVFAHFYLNMGAEVSEGHEQMNDRSYGAIISLLRATGLMPTNGKVSGSLLAKYFPLQNQPGANSPLNTKTAIANIVQEYSPKLDQNKKVVKGDDGQPIMQKRDSIESFLPEGDDEEAEDEAGEDEE